MTLLNQGLRFSTRSSYSAGQRAYLEFCKNFGVSNPIPATEESLSFFITHLARKLAHGTIKSYLFAVRSLHVDLGLPSPLEKCLVLERLLAGVKEVKGKDARPSRLPVTTEVIARFAHLLDSNQTHETRLFLAICTMGTYGLLRSGEFLTDSINATPKLLWSQIDQLSNSYIKVTFLASKSDPFRFGFTAPFFRNDSPSCPVSCFLAYKNQLNPSLLEPHLPVFVLEDGTPVSKSWVVSNLRKYADAIGLQGQRFAGHSFRKGGASSLAAAGVNDSVIKTLGRWKSWSYQLYISLPVTSFRDASDKMSRSQVLFGDFESSSGFGNVQFIDD